MLYVQALLNYMPNKCAITIAVFGMLLSVDGYCSFFYVAWKCSGGSSLDKPLPNIRGSQQRRSSRSGQLAIRSAGRCRSVEKYFCNGLPGCSSGQKWKA